MNRSEAREEAFKQVFQYIIQKEIDTEDIEETFTKLIVEGVLHHETDIKHIIENHLTNWSFNRLPNVEKSILYIATYELLFTDDIPVGVGINEAVELAHKYGDDESSKFINGVLSKIAKHKGDSEE